MTKAPYKPDFVKKASIKIIAKIVKVLGVLKRKAAYARFRELAGLID
jgi:hypothetical protein